MKIKDICFLDIKKIGEEYISLSHYNNKPIVFNIKYLEIFKKIYKENEKYYINFKIDNHENIKIIKLLQNYVCKYIYEKNNIKINIEEFITKTLEDNNIDDNIVKLEIHKNCLILEENDLLKTKQIKITDLNNNDFCDIKIHFIGIKYLEKKYKLLFTVRKIIKYIEDEEELSDFIIKNENIKKKNNLLNDDIITNIIIGDYKKEEIII